MDDDEEEEDSEDRCVAAVRVDDVVCSAMRSISLGNCSFSVLFTISLYVD